MSPSVSSPRATPGRSPGLLSRLTRRRALCLSPFQHTAAATDANANANGNGISNGNEHPVEVIGRIREHPNPSSKEREVVGVGGLQVLSNGHTIRVRTEFGIRDFSLDGVSMAEEEDLTRFYKRFVEARVCGVRRGGKCTVMMYGPTGCGKSHTMFGCSSQPGIIYHALHDILVASDAASACAPSVRVSVVEIYNEEVYDLLSANTTTTPVSSPASAFKFGGCRTRLEVMGKKVKNALFISGNEAAKIAKEVAKVEKRRVVKSTHLNERSSRSHCLITLDVPSVGGRLMLVDMAGSENIDQSGILGTEAKMQTGKINQGNIALKRVVESIANGDPHIPFRDSKLTMLLQDSFEEGGSKILMVLCASPDPRDIHKTIGTLEYGAKAKCIVRGGVTSPSKGKPTLHAHEPAVLSARIAAMDEYIAKLQMDNQIKEKEKEAAQKELLEKEKEVAMLRAKLNELQEKQSVTEVELESRVEERARALKEELLKKFEECEKSAEVFTELGRKNMQKKIIEQQHEAEMLRERLEEIESELRYYKNCGDERKENMDSNSRSDANIAGELVRSSVQLLEGMQVYVNQMKEIHTNHCENDFDNMTDSEECSEELNDLHNRQDTSEEDSLMSTAYDFVNQDVAKPYNALQKLASSHDNCTPNLVEEEADMEMDSAVPYNARYNLETVYEEEEVDTDDTETFDKDIVSEVSTTPLSGISQYREQSMEADSSKSPMRDLSRDTTKAATVTSDLDASRKARIENIFLLCGSYREMAGQARKAVLDKTDEANSENKEPMKSPLPVVHTATVQTIAISPPNLLMNSSDVPSGNKKQSTESASQALSELKAFTLNQEGLSISESPVKRISESPIKLSPSSHTSPLAFNDVINRTSRNKENALPATKENDGVEKCKVYVKWESSKDGPAGKIIHVFEVCKDSTLKDLRSLIVPVLGNENQDFIFLMLGDPTGRPVAKEKEGEVKVSSLPDCCSKKGSRLACLRVLNISRSTQPLNSVENRLHLLNSLSPTSQKQFLSPESLPSSAVRVNAHSPSLGW